MPSGLFTRRQHLQAVITNSWAGRPGSVDYLVVAGGGGGGGNFGGGGGAGGLLAGSTEVTAGSAITVTVGSGGSGAITTGNGTAGGNSVFGSITATGGGYGVYGTSGTNGGSGAGGGGNASVQTLGGIGVVGQGNKGGNNFPQSGVGPAGGGGGAGTQGLTAVSNVAGNGGAGIASDISGTRTTYAAGGGGGVISQTAGTGGAGGGGNGSASGNGSSGTANTGGGGGGAGNNANGGSGGSGVVIVSYPGTTQWYSGGTLSYSNNRVTHTFYSSGTLTPIQPVEYADTTYQISRSLRFNSADSAYLSRTVSVAGNQKTWTWSGWVKRSKLGNWSYIFQGSIGNPTGGMDDGTGIRFLSGSDELELYSFYNGVLEFNVVPNMVFRDTSAWYHIIVAVDTTQSIEANRVKMYVNGSQTTFKSTASGNPTQNKDTYINTTNVHTIGALIRDGAFGGLTFDGYLADIYFIDGLALTPQAFGFTNPNTGVWSPLRYTGSYGTNGFYLNFSDNSNNTAATLGKDNSGNGLNWTPNNFSVTAGAGNDSLVDTPTPYGSDTGMGGEVRGNYCTYNSVSNALTLANGNLDNTQTGSDAYAMAKATLGMSTGKWYWEVLITNRSAVFTSRFGIGISVNTDPLTNYVGQSASSYSFFTDVNNVANAFIVNNAGFTGVTGVGFTTNDVVMFAFDADSGKLWFGKNGTWIQSGNPASGTNAQFSSIPTGIYLPAISTFSGSGQTSAASTNFGQRPFAYSAPSGFKALCTQNLPTPTIGATSTTLAGKYFNPVLWTGNGSTPRNITGVGFQPDLVWIKERSAADDHIVSDSVRGTDGSTYYRLFTNSTSAESVNSQNTVITLNSDGFSIGSGPSVNASADTYVAWNWKANGAGSSNTAGTITSTVSANTTSGFSIVTYTNASSGTVGHGLGVAPKMVIYKDRTNGSNNWVVLHTALASMNDNYLVLNTTGASASGLGLSAAPTSAVISTSTALGGSGNAFVAYCFAAIPGYSAFGSYTGNGSTDGPFVYTGFRPAYVIIKQSAGVTTGADWRIFDNARNTYNPETKILYTNLSDAEGDVGAILDFTSNGFKLRSTYNGLNNSGGTFIYAAFAETPFKYSRAR